jgi:formiminotetrahydrofolate cyclodeaminase
LALIDKPVAGFLDELASSVPAPGGGSVAALSGALGAALVSMVCNLTVGRKKYADVEPEVTKLLARAESLRADLTRLLDEDVAAYTRVSEAMKMPRDTEEQKAARQETLQAALKQATDVPMRIADACGQVIELCGPTADMGNVNAVSDAGVAVLVAEAALRSAALNVMINLGWIEDHDFTAEQLAKLSDLLAGKSDTKEAVYQLVVSKLKC